MTNNNEEITVFAETNFRNAKQRFGIQRDDRRRHMYVIGKTGAGKTNLLETMVISDILAGNGVGVIDPHGEFAEKMLDFVPEHRVKDVIYFDPSDINFPIAFNPIEKVSHEHRHLVASGLMGVFKKIWPDVWSARMEYILRNTLLALLETEGSTILGIMKMFSSKEYRKEVVANVKDPVIKSFWLDEFARYEQRYAVEATAAIQNKIGQFASAAVIRNIVGQKRSAFDMRGAMDEGKILIVNLSKGKIGEDNSNLLGGLIVAKLQLAAMSRVDTPEDERRDFFLYVDEFQNFATESFASILSEARKYHLSLILANQYIAQLSEAFDGGRNTTVRDAVFGNVGTIVSFRVGAEDAEFLEKEFEPEFTANDIVNLPKYNIYLKLLINGLASRAFSAATIAPAPNPPRSFKEEIIVSSRKLYSRDREDIEREIMEWSEIGGPSVKSASSSPKPKAKKSSSTSSTSSPRSRSGSSVAKAEAGEPVSPSQGEQKSFKAFCWECGDKVNIPFRPDGVRPVYCKKHLHLINNGDDVVTDTGPTISLKEAIRDKSANQGGAKKKKSRRSNKSDIDLSKLRDVITEAREY